MANVNGTVLIAFGPQANCTLDLCPLEWSILRYRPAMAANGLFIALFGIAMIIHLVQGIRLKTWWFMGCMISGCVLEIVGYGGRIMIHNNPFDFQGFLMQIICITVAPVFFSAAIYVLLSQTIIYLDASIARFNPRAFYWVFIPVDVLSLVLQAVGGALSSVATTKAGVDQGVNISLAGLVLQVVSLIAFCVLFADYLVTYKRKTPASTMSKNLKVFLAFLVASTLLILLRCVYRIVELHEGYFSHWFRDQALFIALESAVVVAAVFCLNIGHPGYVFSSQDFSHKDTSTSAAESIESKHTSEEVKNGSTPVEP